MLYPEEAFYYGQSNHSKLRRTSKRQSTIRCYAVFLVWSCFFRIHFTSFFSVICTFFERPQSNIVSEPLKGVSCFSADWVVVFQMATNYM